MFKKIYLIAFFCTVYLNSIAQLSMQKVENKRFEKIIQSTIIKYPLLKLEKLNQKGNPNYLLRSTFSINGLSKRIKINNKTYIFQQSIGQKSVIGTFSTPNHILRQGFLQSGSTFKTANKQIKRELNAKIYPNPILQSLKIRFNDLITSPVTIVIYNQLGEIVYRNKFKIAQEIYLQVGRLSSGSYILKIINKDSVYTRKLIKQ